MLIRLKKFVCCGAALSLFAGCGGGATNITAVPDALPFVQCSIHMAGEPVEGAIVTLHATDGQFVDVISNYDSENNCYRFITAAAGVKKGGVPVGKYTVSVKPGPRCNRRIPAKFADPAKSGLEAEINSGENFLPAFELTM